MWRMSTVERVEHLAQLFYVETGYLAPGKDEASAVNSGVSHEDRRKAWDDWTQQRFEQQQELLTDLADALEREQAEVERLRVDKQNLQSALIYAGHEDDCPVVHAASMDCVPIGNCADYRERANQAERDAVALADALNHVATEAPEYGYVLLDDWLPRDCYKRIATYRSRH